MKDGIYEGIPFEEYEKIDALNGSKIVNMRRSPMKYKHELDNPTPPTPAMILGTIVHRMILEPALVGRIAVWGDAPEQKVRNGKVWDAFRAAHDGELILTKKEYDDATNMTAGVLMNAPIRHYANAGGSTEVTLVWTHPRTKRRFKGRIDKLIPETHTIFDLKTTRDCQSYKFGGQAYALAYHIKLAMYAQGYELLIGKEPNVRIGAIDSKPPYESAVYRVTHDILMQGGEELQELTDRIYECEKNNYWPAEHAVETDLILPAYAMASDFEEE